MSHKKRQPSTRIRWNLLQAIGVNILPIIFICACSFTNGSPTTSAQPDMTSWRKTESPLFPNHWPPTSETVWVRYTFAYGNNPAKLIDGAYVTNPLSKTEWKEGISTITALSDSMTQAAVQGVLPLDNQTLKILESGKKISVNSLKMTELPDINTPETKEFLDYYHTWFKYNGAFVGLIRESHADFIDWVTLNK